MFGKPARAASPNTCHDTKAYSLGLQTRAPDGALNRSRSLQGYRENDADVSQRETLTSDARRGHP